MSCLFRALAVVACATVTTLVAVLAIAQTATGTLDDMQTSQAMQTQPGRTLLVSTPHSGTQVMEPMVAMGAKTGDMHRAGCRMLNGSTGAQTGSATIMTGMENMADMIGMGELADRTGMGDRQDMHSASSLLMTVLGLMAGLVVGVVVVARRSRQRPAATISS